MNNNFLNLQLIIIVELFSDLRNYSPPWWFSYFVSLQTVIEIVFFSLGLYVMDLK